MIVSHSIMVVVVRSRTKNKPIEVTQKNTYDFIKAKYYKEKTLSYDSK